MLTDDQIKLLQMAYDQAKEARLTLAELIPTLNVGQAVEVGKIIGATLIIQANISQILSEEVRLVKDQVDVIEEHK